MKQCSGGQRGNTVAQVLIGLIVVAIVVALSKGCDETAPVASSVVLPPVAPAATPAFPPPAPATEPASEALPETAPPRGVAALVVHNPCDQPLLMAVSALDASGVRSSAGFFQVARGARMTPATRSGPLYLYDKTVYFYTETLATEPVEVGRHDEVVGDRQLGMKQAELDPPTVSTITLECPGSTSGRP